MLRIAMVSPYSVSVPGGVQAQVLGLARELRRIGHEVRVLAPCDGPPPEPFVTPLGNSLPTAANGSVAPLAPDPSAAMRTIRALNDEAFDVIHLHEPIVPGPTVTALLLKLAPTVGTFHAAGDSTSYRVLNKTARWAAEHLSVRVAVSDSAKELAHRYLGGEYTVLFNGIEVQRYSRPTTLRETSQLFSFVVVTNHVKD
jgi:phosphatidylinositol alpha-mannosyltransferase